MLDVCCVSILEEPWKLGWGNEGVSTTRLERYVDICFGLMVKSSTCMSRL